MTDLLVLKQYISNFIGKFEVYLKPIFKLILAIITFATINSKLGYMEKIDNMAIVLIASLMCSFMPVNFIVLLAAVFVVLHMYALSLECAIIVLVLFLVLFLMYFRLAPKDTILALLTPILHGMGIPYIMPVAAGLTGNPSSAVSVGCGVIVSCVLRTINDNSTTLGAMETEDMASKFRFLIDTILANKAMILLVVAFAITVIVVYTVKQLPIDFSWSIAILAGAILDAIIVLAGSLSSDADISLGGVILGTVLAIAVGFVIQFFIHNVDYSRTEKVQFEDDDYHYYVKAVPKKTVSVPTRNVKKINASRKRPSK